MTTPWKGARRPMSSDAFARAAKKLGTDEATIRAVWEVESSGRGFRKDGTVERRYEPHHFPGTGLTWRDSLKLSTAKREAAFAAAYAQNPEKAMRATSWGAPQIMGFNHKAAGYTSAAAMVHDMAAREDAHLEAFVAFVESKKLTTHLVARDWKAFALGYNGSGQVDTYARKMESAYRRISGGKASSVVVKLGSKDHAAVVELQRALGVKDDGSFGPATQQAVREFQQANGLHVDGIVGARTWEVLRAKRDAVPPAQEATTDHAAKITGYAGAATAVAGAVATVGGALPDNAMTILSGGAVVAGLMALGAFLVVKVRRAA